MRLPRLLGGLAQLPPVIELIREIVLGAGQLCCGARAHSLARSFFGPQIGWVRRTPMIASRCAALIAHCTRSGAHERSLSPAAPAA